MGAGRVALGVGQLAMRQMGIVAQSLRDLTELRRVGNLGAEQLANYALKITTSGVPFHVTMNLGHDFIGEAHKADWSGLGTGLLTLYDRPRTWHDP
ncbi:MAG: hypothetical protein R3C68_13545 [Myxococcota bacterium]